MTTLRLKLWLTLTFVLCTIALPGFIANRAYDNVRAQNARAAASSQTLSALQSLTVMGYTIHHEKMDDRAGFAKDLDLYIDGVRTHTAGVAQLIKQEMRLTREAAMPQSTHTAFLKEDMQQLELARQTGARLERSLKDQPDDDWEGPAFRAIKIEGQEASEFQRNALDTFESVSKTLTWTFAIAASVGLVGVLWVQQQILRPLSNLWQGTRSIAEGRYNERIPVLGNSEFRTIAQSFNTMASRVENASQSMQDTNEELERAVMRRTAELAATNLSLERANQLRRQFLADASHELRTPLSIMRSEAEITLRAPDTDVKDLRAGLDRVVRLSALMAEMIEDMLYVARAEEPMLPTRIAPLDVVTTVSHCVDEFQRLIEADEGRITITAKPDSLPIESDEHRLQQVIRIVIDNAVCYSTLPPQVEVSVHSEGNSSCIIITDRGDGIAPEHIPYLFQRFRRGGKRVGKGQGLGLSIARSITESLGGTITLESKLNIGTTVSIRLPVLPGPVETDGKLL